MSIKDLTKSGAFVVSLLVVVIVLLPFAVEQIGAVVGFDFPASAWVRGLFASKTAASSPKEDKKVDWDKQLADLKDFSEWADGRGTAKITIVHPEEFQVVKIDSDTITASHCSWQLLLLSDKLEITVTEMRRKLRLVCDPAEKFADVTLDVRPLAGSKQGFLVTAENLSSEGKIGLSYADRPPVYYNVKLRRLWLVPVVSCRSAMRGRYDAAVFFPGLEKGLSEGESIAPGSDKCGYRILSISDHCVWFEAFYGAEPPEETLPYGNWPDFSRVDTMAPTPPPGRLIFGRNRCFWPGDAIRLPNSGTYLMVDDFLAGRAVVFRLLDASLHPIRELLCVIVREK